MDLSPIYIGIYASRETETTLIDQILKLMGYSAGGILGLFVLGMLSRRANGTGAFLGALIATAFVMTMSANPPFGIPELYKTFNIDPLHPLWFTAVSLPATLLLGYALSPFWDCSRR